MKKALLIILMFIAVWFVGDSNYVDSYTPMPTPKFTITIGGPIESDVFLFAKPTKDIYITKIEGILQSGNSATITINKCNSNGESCTAIRANMLFDGDLDSYTSMTSPSVNADQTLQWVTSAVDSPGFLTLIIHYVVME